MTRKIARFHDYLKTRNFCRQNIFHAQISFFTTCFHAQKFLIQPEGQICMFNYVRKFIAVTAAVEKICLHSL